VDDPGRRRIVVRTKWDGKEEIVDRPKQLQNIYIREALKKFYISGVEINCESDVNYPGLGLGWSASFVVALWKAILKFTGKNWDKNELAKEAYEFESKFLGEPGGKQDQYAAVYGGFNYLEFGPDIDFKRKPIIFNAPDKVLRTNDFFNHLMLFKTKSNGEQKVVLTEQQSNIPSCFRFLRQLSDLVLEFKCELEQGSFAHCGGLLHEAWELKKKLFLLMTDPPMARGRSFARSRSVVRRSRLYSMKKTPARERQFGPA
jgi:D-glycero-alpha-D-manno-heptose-7-phosphate kinase